MELYVGWFVMVMWFCECLCCFVEICLVYGECGGYMVMGVGLVDVQGVWYEMVGLLGLEISYVKCWMYLGYCCVVLLGGFYV